LKLHEKKEVIKVNYKDFQEEVDAVMKKELVTFRGATIQRQDAAVLQELERLTSKYRYYRY